MFRTFAISVATLVLPLSAAIAQSPAPAPTGAEAKAGEAAITSQAANAVTAAAAADLKVGAAIKDPAGATVGTIKSVSGENVVISTAKGSAQIPAASVGKSDKGLVIALAKADLEAKISAAASKSK
jgi:hypothetical protein